ncbi:MAG: hypothetical protein WDZ60_03685, partial [Wenzhouxiangellaceae bacterium]
YESRAFPGDLGLRFRARLTLEQGERVARAVEAACDENDSEFENVPAEMSDALASDPVAAHRHPGTA